MFDIGFSELAVVGVVALVVLGPERLPKVARTAGHLFGRLQRYVATVKADLNREMEFSELAKVKQEVQEAARAFEKSTQDHVQSVESEARNISASLEKLPADAAADIAPATQMQMLAAQEEGLTGKNDAVALAEAESSVTPAAVPSIQTPPARVTAPAIAIERGMLDFGIEPVRTSRA